MKPRERVQAALAHEKPDRVPGFEIWIDALVEELGFPDTPAAYAGLGQDGVFLPTQIPAESNAWKSGVDEWGRVWMDGMYIEGVVENEADLEQYSPTLDYATQFFDEARCQIVRRRYPDHCLFYGTHIGPFMQAYMAMGMERFFMTLFENPTLAHQVLQARTEWAIAYFQRAVELGAEIIVMGDDAGHKSGPMISPAQWHEHIVPYHHQIVEALPVPVIWHSDGDISRLLPFAVEAGFAGIHGLEPAANMSLAQVRAEYHRRLVIIGNVDVRVLCQPDLTAVRREVDRCLDEGGSDGGYLFASCNSIFEGMNAHAIEEMCKYRIDRVDR